MTDIPSRGAGILVAVVDSGWNRQLVNPRVRAGVGLVDPIDELGLLRSDDDHDRIGHGTSCARLVLEEAREATVLPIRVFGSHLETTVDHLCEALRIACDSGAQVINMSLATVRPEAAVPLYRACEAARLRGALIVAAADARTRMGFPAVFDNVIGVEAGETFGAEQCEFRPDAAIEFVALGRRPGTRRTRDGRVGSNSFAAARVAGITARLLQHQPTSDLDAVRLALAAAFLASRQRKELQL